MYDPAAGIVGATNYDPYGVPFETYATLDSSLGFTGEFTDLNDLGFLRARYYAPSLGVFTSRDPFDGYLTRVLSRNGYSYAEGNPVNYTDPSGQFIPLIGMLIGGVAGGIVGGLFSAGTASMLYDMAASGNCGCQMQQWACQTDRSEFIGRAALMGVIAGTVLGGFAGLGPLGLGIASAYGTMISGVSALETAFDIISSGSLTPCQQLNLVLSLSGMVLGVVGMNASLTGGGLAGGVNVGIIRVPIRLDGFSNTLGGMSGGAGVLGRTGVTVQIPVPVVSGAGAAVVAGAGSGAVAGTAATLFAGGGGDSGSSEGNDDGRPRLELNPEEIRYTQDSIASHFRGDEAPLTEYISDLQAGRISPNEFPPIRVVRYQEFYWTLDNRRLYIFRQAGVQRITAILEDIADPRIWREFQAKFTTDNQGTSIRVR